jgi:hypothetical protein
MKRETLKLMLLVAKRRGMELTLTKFVENNESILNLTKEETEKQIEYWERFFRYHKKIVNK